MSQLALDISHKSVPTLDNFVTGRNSELLSALRHALSGDSSERSFFLWGEDGCGKSHLLQACVDAAKQAQCNTAYANGIVPESIKTAQKTSKMSQELSKVVAVDNVERLDHNAQIALFNLYNQMRDSGGMLLVSGQASPLHLTLRDDLRTRLGWGLVYQVHTLSDEEKTQALAQHALLKGFTLPPEVSQYLLRHGRRDLPSLMAVLDALDKHSLRKQRAPSVPLLKEILPQQGG